MTASMMIGIPHMMIANHAMSKGNGEYPKMLSRREAPDRIRKMMSLFIPPHSMISSSFFIILIILLADIQLYPCGYGYIIYL